MFDISNHMFLLTYLTGRIFAIDNVRTRTGRGSILKLRVNFLPEIIQLSKEVRNLKNLGFRVPLAIVNKAHQANQVQIGQGKGL